MEAQAEISARHFAAILAIASFKVSFRFNLITLLVKGIAQLLLAVDGDDRDDMWSQMLLVHVFPGAYELFLRRFVLRVRRREESCSFVAIVPDRGNTSAFPVAALTGVLARGRRRMFETAIAASSRRRAGFSMPIAAIFTRHTILADINGLRATGQGAGR